MQVNKKQVEKKKPKRAKTFTGCWTCRSRKVKCDLRRPGCDRCAKSGLECGGYDIKLRWSNLVNFDPYGVQISNNTRNNSNSTTTANNSNQFSNVNDEKQFQRRNVDFVKYKEEYVFHEDMDDELSTLHAPPPEKIADGKTWIIKKFGVFRAINNIETETNSKKRKPKKKSNTNKQIDDKIITKETTENVISPEIYEASNATISCSKEKSTESTANSNSIEDMKHPSSIGYGDIIDFPGFEWISKELREDVLLSAFASQGTPISSSYFEASDNPTGILRQNLRKELPLSSPEGLLSSKEQNDITVHNALQSLFQKASEIELEPFRDDVNNIEENHILNTIDINLTNTDKGMPKTVMEIMPSHIPDKETLEAIKLINQSIDISTTGLMVHGLTRFLLSHYFNNVADLMTVVPLPNKNPWKTLYFPRALAALGDLAGLGHTSNSRNSLLNSLLAVSCFNLKGKVPKNSKAQTFFLNLGIEFRAQAAGFLKSCLSRTVQNERYKDVLTAILSMNSIDVVWGTMSDCQQHLELGEKFIKSRMFHRPKLSEKAKTLHRIFSFLKLIQDSTSLDKVSSEEIVFSTNAQKANSALPQKNIISIRATSLSPEQGLYKEALNTKDGKIEIESVENSMYQNQNDENTDINNTNHISPPIFKNISSESFHQSRSALDISMNIVDIETLYGLPNSLILLFSDCVRIVRHIRYYNDKYIPIPREFVEVCQKFEKKLLRWSPEWKCCDQSEIDGEKCFVDSTIEGLYHHTMSFYNGLIIYYFSMGRDLNNELLQYYVHKVLNHLNKLNDLVESKNVRMVPLIWQGFIAGCASTSKEDQNEFKTWATKLAQTGMGSYWGARQVMSEVWKRRDNEIPGDDWFSVYKDWEMNLMLS